MNQAGKGECIVLDFVHCLNGYTLAFWAGGYNAVKYLFILGFTRFLCFLFEYHYDYYYYCLRMTPRQSCE